ncbi:DUF7544 domain-containing protein [Haloplanus sp. C73]|uniref:DUF7544 domain-containing protein n=1 Tax=Haloplanus sp. C73 TaxID=3421641 RepID=UPI003EB9FB43
MSSWYAFAALHTARDATEDLLRPIDRGQWLRLAVIALFVGVGGNLPTGSGNFDIPSGGGGGTPADVPAPSLPESSTLAILVGIVVLVVALVLLWSLVGAVMEFVLVTGLRDREISIREPFREHFGAGLRLFGFRIAVGLVGLLLIAIPLLAVFGVGMGVSAAFFLLVLPLIFLFALVALVSGVVNGLTTDFVVPAMLAEESGVIAGWRRVWPTLRAEWKQVGLYIVAKFVLGIGVSLAVSIVVLIAAIVLAIPLIIVGGLLYLAASAAGIHAAGWVIFLLFAALFAIALFIVSLLVQVPALTFVRYYSLSVLGMLDSDLDLVGVDRPDEGGGSTDGDDGPTDGDDGSPTADENDNSFTTDGDDGSPTADENDNSFTTDDDPATTDESS